MSNTVKLPTCPKCGLPIPREAPQGLCPKCVLLGAATATEQGVPATATSEIPSIERIAAAFPQLEILELIGRGGMGFVFKARQPHLDRFVALKLLPDKLAKDPQFAERFNREGRVLAKLNHPNITSVFDFGHASAGSETGAPSGQSKTHSPKPGTPEGGFYYLTMEYVDGVNLRQAMRAGRFSPAEALSIVPKVCEALQYAHEQGILHRDIKPENILLDAKGRVKIADFGIAKLVGEDQSNINLTNTGAALGTPHYMAPEQLEKPATVDHRADIYSLGVVFYEMLTGELPIGRFAAPSSKTPVSSTVDDVVFRTLEKDRERRFQSAGEMKTQVEHLGAGSLAQPEVEDEADDEAPRSWLEAVYSMRLAGWFFAALCLVDFASPHVTRLGNSPANTFTLGLSRPWLVNVPLVDAHNVVTREWRFNPSSTSFGVGILGLALVAALLVLRHRVRTTPAVPRSAGRISKRSLYGAISVGLSLPGPMTTLVALLTGMGGVGPGELWLALGSVALPGLGGTLLGWLALNEIRESRGRVKGLPLAMFATLFWPLTILGAVTIGVPMFLLVPGGEPGAARTIGRFMVLVLPAAVIAFSFWTIHSTARWAGSQQVTQQRGVLKWVFIVVLVVGMGVVMVTKPSRSTSATLLAPVETVPMIQFTFTSVELLDERGARWLAMDYVEQVRGDCQHTFRYDARVPGFDAVTFKKSFMSDAKDGFQPVMHQRVMWKLPDSLPQADALALRDLVAKQWTGKSAAIEPGDERVLFKTLVPDGGTLATAVGVRLNSDGNAQGAVRQETSPPSKEDASAERWAPALSPGEKPNLTEILQEASRLTDEGRHEEALQRHIWYHNHALTVDSAQAGVRLSYALTDWMKLARHYPKAREALVEITDRAARAFAGGEGSYGLFAEVNSINGQLGRQKETLALFDSIQSQDHRLARQCYLFVEDLLVEKGDYALCESFIPDFQKRFETIRSAWQRTLQLSDRNPEANRNALRQYAQMTFIKDTRKLVEILVGVSRNTEAVTICDQAVALLDVPELRSAVADAEEKVAKHSVVPGKP